MKKKFLTWNREMFRKFASYTEIVEYFKGFDKILQVDVRDIGTSFQVIFGEKSDFITTDLKKPDIQFITDNKTWEELVSYKVNMPDSYLKGKLLFWGDTYSLMKICDALDRLHTAYMETKNKSMRDMSE